MNKPHYLSAGFYRLAAWLLALMLAALACNMPYLAGQGEQLEAEIDLALAQELGQPVKNVRLEGDLLVLTLDVPLVQAQETTLEQVTRLLQAGAVQAARASQVRVEIEQRGLPFVAITAQAKDARLLAEGQLAVEAFLAGLQIDDRRPVEQAIRQELQLLGYTVRSVSYQDGVLELAFWQPEIDATPALVQSWLPAWQVAAWKAPDASQVVLHAGLLGQPDLRVAASMQHLRAFQDGELSAAEFLLGLDIQDE